MTIGELKVATSIFKIPYSKFFILMCDVKVSSLHIWFFGPAHRPSLLTSQSGASSRNRTDIHCLEDRNPTLERYLHFELTVGFEPTSAVYKTAILPLNYISLILITNYELSITKTAKLLRGEFVIRN